LGPHHRSKPRRAEAHVGDQREPADVNSAVVAVSERVSIVGPNAPPWEGGGSRSSKTSYTPEGNGSETDESTFEDLTPDEW